MVLIELMFFLVNPRKQTNSCCPLEHGSAMIQPAWQIIAECEIQKEDPWDYVNDGAWHWFEKWLSIVNVINDFAAHSLSWFDVFLICLMCFVMLCSTNALVLYISWIGKNQCCCCLVGKVCKF